MKHHWLDKVIEILNSDSTDLRELAEMAGGNPKTFYRGVDLSGVDLRGQDLSGMEFTNLNLNTLLYDERTKIDKKYISINNTIKEPTKKIKEKVENYDEDRKNREKTEESMTSLLNSGRNLYKKRMYRDALGAFQKAMTLYPRELDPVMEAANCYRAIKKHEKSAELYSIAQSLSPNSFEAWRGLGYALRQMKSFRQALDIDQQMVKKFPRNPYGWIELSKLYQQMGEREKAITAVKSGIEENEENVFLWERLGDISSNLKRDGYGARAYRIASRAQPSNMKLLRKYCNSLIKNGEADEAKAYLRTLEDRYPENIQIKKMELEILIEEGSISLAEHKFIELMSITKNEFSSEKWFVDTLKKYDLNDRALYYATRIAKEFPKNAIAWKTLGEVLAALGSHDSAVLAFEHAVTASPNTPAPRKWLAEELFRAGDTRRARRVLHDAYEEFRDVEDVSKWLEEFELMELLSE